MPQGRTPKNGSEGELYVLSILPHTQKNVFKAPASPLSARGGPATPASARLGTNLPGSAVRQAGPRVDSSHLLTSETHAQKLSDGENPRSVNSRAAGSHARRSRGRRGVWPPWRVLGMLNGHRAPQRTDSTRTETPACGRPQRHSSPQPKRPSADGPRRHVPTAGYYSAIRGLTCHAMLRHTMNLDNVLPSGRSQSERAPLTWFGLYKNVPNRPVHGRRKQVGSCQRLGLERGVRAGGDGCLCGVRRMF